MLINLYTENQLCNRLFSLLPMLSYSLYHREKLIILFFPNKYHALFPQLTGHPMVKFVFLASHLKLTKCECRIIGMLQKVIKKEISGECRNYPFISGRLIRFNGWKHSEDYSFIADNYHDLCELFAPTLCVQKDVNKQLEILKKKYLLVGVHIRRGDYAEFVQGKYYFQDCSYICFMKQIQQVFRDKEICFLIATNDCHFDKSAYQQFEYYILNDNSYIKDLYALSLCDYIIGPPSTYSQWASFYGRVPMAFITDVTQKLDREDFSPIMYLNRFENGRILKFNATKEEFYIEFKG